MDLLLRDQKQKVYDELFNKRLKEHLDIGVTENYFRCSRVYWWTLYFLDIEPVGHPDQPIAIFVRTQPKWEEVDCETNPSFCEVCGEAITYLNELGPGIITRAGRPNHEICASKEDVDAHMAGKTSTEVR